VSNKEIDFLIAEKVLNWHLRPFFNSNSSGWYKEDGYYSGKNENTFKPSTDIGSAWEIIKYLNENDYVVTITAATNTHTEVSIERTPSGFEVGLVTAETAPMAICLGALQSAGINIE
jgi:hypothetical protein